MTRKPYPWVSPNKNMMKATKSCPNCGKVLTTASLGNEPTRLICGRFGCQFDGKTINGGE